MEMAVEAGVQHFRLRNHTRMFADPLICWLVAFFGSHKLGIVSEKSPIRPCGTLSGCHCAELSADRKRGAREQDDGGTGTPMVDAPVPFLLAFPARCPAS